jgi:hypothetical protein
MLWRVANYAIGQKRTMSVDEFYAWKACVKATLGHLSVAQIIEMAGIATSHFSIIS